MKFNDVKYVRDILSDEKQIITDGKETIVIEKDKFTIYTTAKEVLK